MTDEHFAAAAKTGDQRGMRQPVLCRTDSHTKSRTIHAVRENARFVDVVGILENALVAEEGGEHVVKSSGKTPIQSTGGTKSGTLDLALAIVIDAWPMLDADTRSAIVGMVRTAVEAARMAADRPY